MIFRRLTTTVGVTFGAGVDVGMAVSAGKGVFVGKGVLVGSGVFVSKGESVGGGVSAGKVAAIGWLIGVVADCSTALHPATRPATAATLINSRLEMLRGRT
jgi:UDP-3-O-[3-hydroxymyristoyl] glucosamine N-acyltransferase